jgi:shikimate kinase
MAVGKTSVARSLARYRSWTWLDLDDYISNTHGSIKGIFKTVGEAQFRTLEYQALQTAITSNYGVISTGGGVVTHAPSRDLLQVSPPVVWLRASFNVIQRRLRKTSMHHRPLADDRLKERFFERQGWYKACASHAIDVDNLSIQDIAEIIINRYG